MDAKLPIEFASLEPFVSKWGLPTEQEQSIERRRSTREELKAFYDAIVPLVPAILKRADQYPIGKTEGVDRTLFHMALALVEIAPNIEFYKGSPGIPFAFQEDRMLGHESTRPD